jgi:hypothetical protein
MPATPKKEDRSMEHKTIEVPAFYPNPQNPDLWNRWDGSEEAWMWKSAIDFRNYAKINAAAYFYAYTQDWSSIPGLLIAAGWEPGLLVDDEAVKFIEANRDEIESHARLL